MCVLKIKYSDESFVRAFGIQITTWHLKCKNIKFQKTIMETSIISE